MDYQQDYPDGFTSTGVYPLLQTSVELTEDEPTEGAETTQVTEGVQPTLSTEPADGSTVVEGPETMETMETANAVDAAETVDPVKERVVSEKEMDDQFLHLCIRVGMMMMMMINEQCLHDVGSDELPMQTSSFNSKYLSQPEFINKHYASEYCRRW